MKAIIKKARKIFTIKLLVLLAIVGVIGYGIYNGQQPVKLTDSILNGMKPITAQIKDLTQVVIATGTLESNNERSVLANYSGSIYDMKVSENDYVKKDQVVARIEEVNPVTKYKTRHDLKAPAAGTVISAPLNPGDPVINGQTIIIKLADINDLKITTDIVEADINKVVVGQPVKITFATANNEVISGKVNFISLAPTSLTNNQVTTSAALNNVSQTYSVIISMDQKPNNYKLGYTADLEIEVARKNQILTINDSYIFKQTGKYYVKAVVEKVVSENGSVKIEKVLENKEVTLGFRGETDVEILTGLKAGDQIVLPSSELQTQRGGMFGFGG